MGIHRYYSANGLSKENRYVSRGLFTYRLNGATDRFKEDLIEIFIFSLPFPPRETIVVHRGRHPFARGRALLFIHAVWRGNNPRYLPGPFHARSRSKLSRFCPPHVRCARIYVCIYLGAASFSRCFAGKFAGAYIQTSGEVALRRRSGVFARRAPGAPEFARNRIAPSNNDRKIGRIVGADSRETTNDIVVTSRQLLVELG